MIATESQDAHQQHLITVSLAFSLADINLVKTGLDGLLKSTHRRTKRAEILALVGVVDYARQSLQDLTDETLREIGEL